MRCRLCGAKTVAITPPPKIKATLPGHEIVRARMCVQCHYSWTTIERPFNPVGVEIKGRRVVSSESYDYAKKRKRLVDGQKIETMEETMVFDNKS